MQRTTRLGAGLLAVGSGAALVATGAADHGHRSVAVAAALASGAMTALGAVAVVIAWAGRRDADRDEAGRV